MSVFNPNKTLRQVYEEEGKIKSIEMQTKERIEGHKEWETSPKFQFPIGSRIKVIGPNYTGTVIDRLESGSYVVHLDRDTPENRVTFQPSSLELVEKAQYPRVGGI